MLILWFFAFNALYASLPDPLLDYQKHLSRMSHSSEAPYRPSLLATARNKENGISSQDYSFLKGTSAFAASCAELAHKTGILGTDVTVLLLENSGINHVHIKEIVEAGSPEKPTEESYCLDHGSAMASLIHAIAPHASIRVRPTSEVGSALTSIKIINASFSSGIVEGFQQTFPNIAAANNVLIMQSAGNYQQNLSTDNYTQNADTLLPFTIFAGSLKQDYKEASYSGFPGNNIKFQQSFLWVVSDYVLTATGTVEYSPTSGTSNATAILSGAAALIASMHPSFSAKDVREILLESADRDIFQEYGSGYRVLHIPDNSVAYFRQQYQVNKGEDSLSAIQHEHVPIMAYNPQLWGKGILNIKNALLYAHFKILHPEMSKNELRENLLRIININQQIQAKKIQKVFKNRKKLSAETILSRPTLTVNLALLDREFPDTETLTYVGNLKRKFKQESIPELTNAQRLKKLGIQLPEYKLRSLRVRKNSTSSIIPLNEWKPCKAPQNAQGRLTTFIQANKYTLDSAFHDLCFNEFYIWHTPYHFAESIIDTFGELLYTPFDVNRVIRLYRDWTESHEQYVTKHSHEPVTIIGLIHDSIRNKDSVNKPAVTQIAMHLFKKIQEHEKMNDFVCAQTLALLKDTMQPNDTSVLLFVVQNKLLRQNFKAYEMNYDEETDMHNLETKELLGKDLFSIDTLERFLNAQYYAW